MLFFTHLNGFNYCYLKLFADSEVIKIFLFNTNYSNKHDLFNWALSNGPKYCYVIPINLIKAHSKRVLSIDI